MEEVPTDVQPEARRPSRITINSVSIMEEFNSDIVCNHNVILNHEDFGIDVNGDPIVGAYISKGLTSQLYSSEKYNAMTFVIEGWEHDLNLFVLKATDQEKYLETKIFCTSPINFCIAHLNTSIQKVW